jgi:hypothetical protein
MKSKTRQGSQPGMDKLLLTAQDKNRAAPSKSAGRKNQGGRV